MRDSMRAIGKHIALFNVEGNYYAIDDTCTHKGRPGIGRWMLGYV